MEYSVKSTLTGSPKFCYYSNMFVEQTIIHLYGPNYTYMNALKCIHVFDSIFAINSTNWSHDCVEPFVLLSCYSSRSIAQPWQSVRFCVSHSKFCPNSLFLLLYLRLNSMICCRWTLSVTQHTALNSFPKPLWICFTVHFLLSCVLFSFLWNLKICNSFTEILQKCMKIQYKQGLLTHGWKSLFHISNWWAFDFLDSFLP